MLTRCRRRRHRNRQINRRAGRCNRDGDGIGGCHRFAGDKDELIARAPRARSIVGYAPRFVKRLSRIETCPIGYRYIAHKGGVVRAATRR